MNNVLRYYTPIYGHYGNIPYTCTSNTTGNGWVADERKHILVTNTATAITYGQKYSKDCRIDYLKSQDDLRQILYYKGDLQNIQTFQPFFIPLHK